MLLLALLDLNRCNLICGLNEHVRPKCPGSTGVFFFIGFQQGFDYISDQ